MLKNRTETEQTVPCCCGLTSPWLRTKLRCWSGDIPACNSSPESETGRTSSWISTSRPRTKDSSARREREREPSSTARLKQEKPQKKSDDTHLSPCFLPDRRNTLRAAEGPGSRAPSPGCERGSLQGLRSASSPWRNRRNHRSPEPEGCYRHMIHDAPNVAFITFSCVSEPRVCDVKSRCFTVSEGGTPPTYKGPVRRVRSPPGILFDWALIPSTIRLIFSPSRFTNTWSDTKTEGERVRNSGEKTKRWPSRVNPACDLTVCHWSSLYFLRLRRLTFLFPPSNRSSRWPSDTLSDITAPRWPPAA